jgi:hypothetical protein
MMYGAVAVLPAHIAWHRRDARALASGNPPPRISLAKASYLATVIALAGVTMAALLPTSSTPDGLLAMGAAGLAILVVILTFVPVHGPEETPTPLQELSEGFAATFKPLYPAFAYSIFQYNRAAVARRTPPTPLEPPATLL